MAPGEFRSYLFPHDHPRLAGVRGLDPYHYREAARHDDFTGGLIKGWTPLYLNEFHGITEAGRLREGLYPLTAPEPGERAPVGEMVAQADALLELLDDDQRAALCHAVDAPQWQTWANPEFMQFDTGLRLEFLTEPVRERALALVAASLSPRGYDLVRAMMRINGFLGSIVDLETILGEFSYNVALFGEPDEEAPWGWQLFGHHCAVNCLVAGGRMVVSPVFLGAEPDAIDEGPHAGPPEFQRRIDLGRRLMAELTPQQRRSAILFEQMVDPDMPPGRVHPGDERHLAGAFQDNRVIPFEGTPVSAMTSQAQDLVLDIVGEFLVLLPDGPRAARLREVRALLRETWFCWIGGYGPGEVFYYRIQSPVLIAELDHHCGVFLDYTEPKPFHVHTVLRTPHGNDYGRRYVQEYGSRPPRAE